MEILLAILAALCLMIGLAGCIVPVLPGPPLSYVGLWLLHWGGYGDFTVRFLVIWAVVTGVVTLLDYYLPVLMTKRFGGSRSATIGSVVGLVAGLFLFPPVGMIVCPFFGALIGELMHDRTDSARAFRVAMGSFLAFLLGTGAKLIACGIMLFYGIRAFFV